MVPDWMQMSAYLQQLRQFSRRAAVHQRLALSPSELELLSLSRSMGLQQVNVSRLLRGLRGRGLVDAVPAPDDRRSHTLSLTEAGRQALQESYQAYLSPLYRIREVLGREEFTALMEAVARANRLLDGAERRGGGQACPSMD